ncbi:hypothetical protein, partial [Arthrobacter pullicola]|uniref:hypothetical protein n=1 Tax=Arthrobacter pullicola TaxID=2762224 RepID=UPI001CD8B278
VGMSVSRTVIVRLVMVSVSRSAAIVVSVSRSLVVTIVVSVVRSAVVGMSVSRSTVTVATASLMPVGMSVSRTVIVRLVMVSVSRSAAIVATASRSLVAMTVEPVSRSARTQIDVRRLAVRSGAMIPGAMTGPEAPRKHRLPSASTTPATCAAQTAQIGNGHRKLMMTSQVRSWTRSPEPSCATSKRSMVNGFPSTW